MEVKYINGVIIFFTFITLFLQHFTHSSTLVVDGVSQWKNPSVQIGDSISKFQDLQEPHFCNLYFLFFCRISPISPFCLYRFLVLTTKSHFSQTKSFFFLWDESKFHFSFVYNFIFLQMFASL